MNSLKPDTLLIVLATHNGEDFLAAQIGSLSGQTVADWRLLISDDGSTDATPEMIRAYADADPRIRLLPSSGRAPRGAARNFSRLLDAAQRQEAEYVFCCDQDDVWEPQKLERMLACLKRTEGAGKQPSLVHHDLAVVDDNLGPLADSFWQLMALKPGNEDHPGRLLSRNEVTGCAMACNRALLELALPMPEEAIMHDWWLALHAAFFGRLEPMGESLVRYRQHGANQIGARSYRAGLNPLNNWLATWRDGNAEFLATVSQATAFSAHIAGFEKADAAVEIAETYARIPGLPRSRRLDAIRRAGVWRNQWLLDAVLAARVLLLPGRAGR